MPNQQPVVKNISETPGKLFEGAKDEAGKIVSNTTSQVFGTNQKSQELTPEQKNANKQEVEGLYGGREALMDPQKYSAKHSQDQTHRQGLIDQILGELLGKKPTLTPEQKKRMETEHKNVAENLSAPNGANQQKAEEERKKKEVAEEEERKKLEKERKMEEVVGVEGKSGGPGFARKKTAPRMQKPPKTSENKAGNGIGG